MTTSTYWDAVVEFAHENEVLIEVIIFVLGFAESLVFVSAFIPASVLFLALAAVHSAGEGPFLPILLAGAAGCLLGDIVSFAIGWRVREDVYRCWPFNTRPELLNRMRNLFEQRGSSAIYISKFVGPLRPVGPFIAGAMHMKWPVFVVASCGSSLIWAAAFLAPGYYGLQLFK